MKYKIKALSSLALSLFFSDIVSSVFAQNQTTISDPIWGESNSEYLRIVKLNQKKKEFVITFELNCFEGTEYQVAKTDSSAAFGVEIDGKNYPLKGIKGLEFKNANCKEPQLIYFDLIFKKIPKKAKHFHLVEGDGKGGKLYFKNVLLENKEEAEKQAIEGNSIAQFTLGQYYEREYEYEKAKEYYQMNAEMLLKDKNETAPEYLQAKNQLIKLSLNLGDFDGAKKQALEIVKNAKEKTPQIVKVMYTLGDIYQAMGEHQNAIDSYLEYLRLLEKQKIKPQKNKYIELSNLISYSYGYVLDNPKNNKPLAIGSTVNEPNKKTKKEVLLQSFAIGADYVMISSKADFSDGVWQDYHQKDKSLTKVTNPNADKLYVRFKNYKERISDTVEVVLH